MNEKSTSTTALDPRDDAPKLTADRAARAQVSKGGVVLREASPPLNRGRPPKAAEERKQQVTMRLSPALLRVLRSTGPGWQTKVEKVLQAVFLGQTQEKKAEMASMWSKSAGGVRLNEPIETPLGGTYAPTKAADLVVTTFSGGPIYTLVAKASSGADLDKGGWIQYRTEDHIFPDRPSSPDKALDLDVLFSSGPPGFAFSMFEMGWVAHEFGAAVGRQQKMEREVSGVFASKHQSSRAGKGSASRGSKKRA